MIIKKTKLKLNFPTLKKKYNTKKMKKYSFTLGKNSNELTTSYDTIGAESLLSMGLENNSPKDLHEFWDTRGQFVKPFFDIDDTTGLMTDDYLEETFLPKLYELIFGRNLSPNINISQVFCILMLKLK